MYHESHTQSLERKGVAASGHKTMEVFKRYNTLTEEEIRELVPALEDANMDTK